MPGREGGGGEARPGVLLLRAARDQCVLKLWGLTPNLAHTQTHHRVTHTPYSSSHHWAGMCLQHVTEQQHSLDTLYHPAAPLMYQLPALLNPLPLLALPVRSAGTVEFLVDEDTKKFYFLEVNTRLQVSRTQDRTCVFAPRGGVRKGGWCV